MDAIIALLQNVFFVQGLGFIALLLQVLSMQGKSYKSIIVMTVSSECLFGVQLLLLGAFTGATTNLMAGVCNTVYYFCNKSGRKTTYLQILFSILFVTVGILTWEGPISLLVILAKVISTVSHGTNRPYVIRVSRLISMPMWVVYDGLAGTIGGTINDLLVIASSIIGIIRLDKKTSSGR
ncbi:MAG: YgjV family protein [Clostridia bacterium]|nr:YgjV family protein [Clostridia bacterium]